MIVRCCYRVYWGWAEEKFEGKCQRYRYGGQRMISYSQMDVQVWTSDKSRPEREIEELSN